jgi:hypothetical protein
MKQFQEMTTNIKKEEPSNNYKNFLGYNISTTLKPLKIEKGDHYTMLTKEECYIDIAEHIKKYVKSICKKTQEEEDYYIKRLLKKIFFNNDGENGKHMSKEEKKEKALQLIKKKLDQLLTIKPN